MHNMALLMLLCLTLGVGASWPGAPHAAETRQRSSIVVHRGESIQEAVDQVSDGGVVIVEPGTYSGSIRIAKTVDIIGSGIELTQIVGEPPRDIGSTAEATGLVTYEAGGGGGIRALTLRGGPNGIVGRATAGSVSVKSVLITGTGRGVLWTSRDALTVKNSEVREVSWHGIAVSEGVFSIDFVAIHFALGAGIFINSGGATCDQKSLNQVTVTHATLGGIVVYKSGVCIFGATLQHNALAGLYGIQSAILFQDSVATHNEPQSDGLFGDGITTLLSEVLIKDSFVGFNPRAGVANFSGHTTIVDSTLLCNGFDLEGNPYPFPGGPPFSFDGSHGWLCSPKPPLHCALILPGENSCHVETSQIQAPAELPPADPLPN
jgi:hypothetical protein